MMREHVTHFFDKPVVDWTPETADAFDYQHDTPPLRLSWDLMRDAQHAVLAF